MTIAIDNTILRTVARCDTEAVLRHVLGLTTVEESAALASGTAAHEALAAWLGGVDLGGAMGTFTAHYGAFVANCARPQDIPARLSLVNLTAVLAHWFETHPLTALPYVPDAELVEVAFAVPLDDAGEFTFTGRLDAVVRDRQHGLLYVLDHKAQPLWVNVLTPRGWLPMADVKPGSYVIGANGLPVQVLGVYPQGKVQTYKVTFNDGASTYCTDEHLWNVRTQFRLSPWQTRTLKDIRGALQARPYLRFQVPVSESVHYFPGTDTLPLDPYLLGVLLGDGYLNGNSVALSSNEVELINLVKQHLPDDVVIHKARSLNYSWIIKGKVRPWNSVLTQLREMSLMGTLSATKFVPARYLRSTEAERLALLQGLLDTDGCIYQSHIMYDSTSLALVEAVVELTRSLGGLARFRRRTGTKQQAYRAHLRFPKGVVPFRLKRKASKVRPRQRFARYIKTIELSHVEECQCIKVAAPDGLYITDDFVVTHNTTGRLTPYWARKFRKDSQMSGYVWAAEQTLGQRVTGIYINAIEFAELPGSDRKCKTHSVAYAECGPEHAKSETIQFDRHPAQLERWRADALTLARRYAKLLERFGDRDALPNVAMNGVFHNACDFCAYSDFCDNMRPQQSLDTMFVESRWVPGGPR